jgi:Bacterial SH3 domain
VLKGSSGSDHSQYSESNSDAGGLPVSAKSTSSQSGGTVYEAIEWAKVTFPAKAHSEASVSSPILRFYQLGTVLQVVSRENGWVQVTDPTSQETGWVFERFLVPADGPTVGQTALATTTSKAVTESTPAKPVLSAKKRGVVPRSTVRIRESVALAQFDRRWDRRHERRGGFGLFFFGRFARAE